MAASSNAHAVNEDKLLRKQKLKRTAARRRARARHSVEDPMTEHGTKHSAQIKID